MSLGDNIKLLRGQNKWTQADLSKWSGIKVGHISKLENNDSDPKLSTIYKLMNALNCSADELLMDENYSPLSGTVKQCFQRVEKLMNEDKEILLHVIHKYCDAQRYREISTEIEVAQHSTEKEGYIRAVESEMYEREDSKEKSRLKRYIEHDEKFKNK